MLKNSHVQHLRVNHAPTNLITLAGLLSCAGILIGGACFLNVFTIGGDSASATSTTGSSTMDMAVNLDPTIEVWTTEYNPSAGTPCTATADAEVSIDADPDENVYSDHICAHASANTTKGYTLTMATTTATPNLNHTTKASMNPITPLTDTSSHAAVTTNGVSASDWESDADLNNTWGYGLEGVDNYKPVPGSADTATVDVTDAPTNDGTTQVTFGTKIDIAQAAGSYTNVVVFSAVANIDSDAYMQDFTPQLCKEMTPWGYNSATSTVIQGTTKSLWDKRDGQEYKVRRLADGNCWMVENLNLSAESLTANGHSTTLDSSDTDLTSGTFTVPATSNTNWGGDSYPVEPKIATSAQSGYTDYGMYYNWWAATARTDNPTSGVAENSICPKGWDLPTGNTNNQWYQLFDAYKSAYGWTNINGSGNDMSKINTTNLLSNDTVGPNLQFSGYWGYSGTVPYTQSSGGNWWSSTVISEARSYYAHINSIGDVHGGMSSSYKRHGFSVRCMLPTGS